MRKSPLIGWLVVVALSLILLSCATSPPIASGPRDTRAVPPGSPTSSSPPAAIRPAPAPTEPVPGSLAYLDVKNGFRDLKFGGPPPSDVVLQEEEAGDTKYYTRPNDDLTLGGAQLQRIVYGFYLGRFFWVLLQTKGLGNSRAMLEVMRQAYGPGYQGNRFLQQFAWLGSRVQALYTENSITSNADTVLQSRSITAAREADQKTKARKGVGNM